MNELIDVADILEDQVFLLNYERTEEKDKKSFQNVFLSSKTLDDLFKKISKAIPESQGDDKKLSFLCRALFNLENIRKRPLPGKDPDLHRIDKVVSTVCVSWTDQQVLVSSLLELKEFCMTYGSLPCLPWGSFFKDCFFCRKQKAVPTGKLSTYQGPCFHILAEVPTLQKQEKSNIIEETTTFPDPQQGMLNAEQLKVEKDMEEKAAQLHDISEKCQQLEREMNLLETPRSISPHFYSFVAKVMLQITENRYRESLFSDTFYNPDTVSGPLMDCLSEFHLSKTNILWLKEEVNSLLLDPFSQRTMMRPSIERKMSLLASGRSPESLAREETYLLQGDDLFSAITTLFLYNSWLSKKGIDRDNQVSWSSRQGWGQISFLLHKAWNGISFEDGQRIVLVVNYANILYLCVFHLWRLTKRGLFPEEIMKRYVSLETRKKFMSLLS